MAGLIRRGLAGGGEALEVAGFKMLQSSLDELRQTRLEELRASHAAKAQERRFEQEKTMELDVRQPFVSGERRKSEEFQRSMETDVRQPFQERQQGARLGHEKEMQKTRLEAAAKQHAASLQVQREGQAIQSRQVAVLEQGADLDREIKKISLDNAKRVDQLRTEFSGAAPERKQSIQDEIRVLTGKDNEQFLPVPLKDDMGNVTGYQIFDKRRGSFVNNPGATGGGSQPTPADIQRLQSLSGNPQAVAAFDARFGAGAAEKHIKQKAAPKATPKAIENPTYDEEGELREPEEEPRAPVRRGAARRGIINRAFDPELLNRD